MRQVHRALAVAACRSAPRPPRQAMDPPGAAAAARADRASTGPDQTLFDEAVLIYSNAVRRQHGRPPLRLDPGLLARRGRACRNMARLRTHSHGLPVRGQKRAVAADGPPVAELPPGRREHRDGQGLPPARPADLDELARLRLHLRRHDAAGADPHLRQPRRSRWWRAGWPRRSTAPRCCRRASGGSAPASASTRRARPAATSTWCRTSPTDAGVSCWRPGWPGGRRGGGRSPRCGRTCATSSGRTERVWK